jgi:hypothetical protein
MGFGHIYLRNCFRENAAEVFTIHLISFNNNLFYEKRQNKMNFLLKIIFNQNYNFNDKQAIQR